MKKSKVWLLIGFSVLLLGVIGGIVLGGQSASSIEYPEPPDEALKEKVNANIIHNENKWTTNNTHDGEIIKVDDTYYVFSTDYKVAGEPTPGIMVRKSTDLIHWEFIGRVFESVPEEAREWTNGASIFWAPDVVEMDGTFYLYYSVSEFGTKNSYIGLATSESIEGPWQDEGEVFKTTISDDYKVNAIDPGIIFDRDENPWMVFGSYQGGIFITELDRNTGKLKQPGDEGTLIANRGSQDHQALEGPAIIFNEDTDMFYLTVSYGWLEDTYNVRVGRSTDITGPYTDYNGNDLVDIQTNTGSPDVGTKIVGPYMFDNDSGWQGTGHNGLLKDGDDYFLIHNARAGHDIFWSHLHVRKMVWTEDGWPVVSPQRYAGEVEQPISEKDVVGEWEKIVVDRLFDDMRSSRALTLHKNGKVNDTDGEDYWELSGDNTITIYESIGNGEFMTTSAIVLPAWDWENWNETIVFTGLDDTGTAIWGKKVE